jgi:DNA uptake protein ComE-like DNA-binding protein
MRAASERGLILLVVLWIMVVLTILGTSYFHLTSLESQTVRNDLEKYEATLLAESALYLAVADLNLESAGGYFDLSGDWSGAGKLFEEASLGDGLFQVYTDDVNSEEGGTRFGLRDESSKLNLNTATKEMLEKLPNMTSAMAAAIIDWRDSDDTVTPGGAEKDYYSEQSPSYEPANGPFTSLGELLQVKGFTPRLLFGEDINQDGVLQAAEDDGRDNDPPDNRDGRLDRGLISYLTIYSYDLNVNAAGLARLNINSASEETIKTRLTGKISDESVKKIVEARKQKKFESLAQLLAPPPAGTADPDKKDGSAPAAASSPSAGEPSHGTTVLKGPSDQPPEGSGAFPDNGLVTVDEFESIFDEVTVAEKKEIPGLVNINTAPMEVLVCLPGMSDRLAEEVISRRGADQTAFKSPAELASIEGMNLDTLSKLLPVVTVQSYAFEARTVGYLPRSKAYAEVHAVIDRGEGRAKFLDYRVVR